MTILKIDYAIRGSGKTTRCVFYAIKNDCILIVPNKMTRELIEKKWKEAITVGALEVKTIDEYVRFRSLYKDRHIVIDNADWCLQTLLGAIIEMVSIDDESAMEEPELIKAVKGN